MLSQSSQDQTQAMDEGTPAKHMSTGATLAATDASVQLAPWPLLPPSAAL